MPDPNASVLSRHDVDLSSAEWPRIRLLRPAALGCAWLSLDGRTFEGEVVHADGGTWFVADEREGER